MAVKETDALTGTETTGHEWDGIKELNTPLPKWWLWVFYATIVFAVFWTVFYPAWPSLSGYTSGLLGYSAREQLNQQLAAVEETRAPWFNRIAALDVSEVAVDDDLLRFSMAGGKTIFADNCAPCHGTGGAGAPSFPILVDDDWIWGGTVADIYQTIQHGIRNTDPDTRFSQMPAFGADGLLTAEEIRNVAQHVLSLSNSGPANAAGATIFAEQCAACHGEDGRGLRELGGPNLTDTIWLYGGTQEAVVSQITRPRHGVMPPWTGRLNDVEIKQVAVYVHSLGGGE